MSIKNDVGPTFEAGGRAHRPLDDAGAVPDPGPTVRNGGLPDISHTRKAGRPFLEERPRDNLLERALSNTIRRVDLLEQYILAQSKPQAQVVATVAEKELTWGDVSRLVLRKLFGGKP